MSYLQKLQPEHFEDAIQANTQQSAKFAKAVARQKLKLALKRTILIGMVLLACFLVSSCGPHSNPILGKWKPQSTRSMISAREIEFTQDQMILGDGRDQADRIPVNYKIEGNDVIVLPQAGATGPLRCTPTEGGTLTCDMAFTGKTVYVRRDK